MSRQVKKSPCIKLNFFYKIIKLIIYSEKTVVFIKTFSLIHAHPSGGGGKAKKKEKRTAYYLVLLLNEKLYYRT
jgi:hypothetical protein